MPKTRDFTILIDSREQHPLPFPSYIAVLDPSHPPTSRKSIAVRLITKRLTLLTGDYADASLNSLVERKAGILEIAQNHLTPDASRFHDCLTRLSQSGNRRLLLLEGTPTDLSKPLPFKQPVDPGLAVDALIQNLLHYNIPWLMVPASTLAQRRKTGEWVARYLIQGAIQDGDFPR